MKLWLKIVCAFLFLAITSNAQVVSMNVAQLHDRFVNNKDTTFVVNFWATWCKPCVEELPVFESITKKFSAEKVKVLLISLDFKNKVQSVLIPFVEKRNLQSEVIWLNEKNYDTIIDRVHSEWSGSLPATMIIAPGNTVKFFKEGTITDDELIIHFSE